MKLCRTVPEYANTCFKKIGGGKKQLLHVHVYVNLQYVWKVTEETSNIS